jgi:hypothetical protein
MMNKSQDFNSIQRKILMCFTAVTISTNLPQLEDGVLEALGGLLLTFRASGQEVEDVIGGDGTDFAVTELVIEFVQEKAVTLDRIFSPS